MDKFIQKYLIGLLLITLLGFTACVNDDEPADPSTHNPNLVGKWKMEAKLNNYSLQETIEFKSNGVYIDNATGKDGNNKYSVSIKGIWTSTHTHITLTVTEVKSNFQQADIYVGLVETMAYKVINKELFIDNGEIPYLKQ